MLKSALIKLSLLLPFFAVISLASSSTHYVPQVSANHELCGFSSPQTVTPGASVTIGPIVGGQAGDEFGSGITDASGAVVGGALGTWTKPAAGTDGTITLTAPSTPGTYDITVNNAGAARRAGEATNICVTPQAWGDNLIVSGTAVPSPVPGAGTTCITGAATSGDAIDRLNCRFIEVDEFDDKAFVKNQFGGLIDAGYLFLTGRSILTPEVDNVTAGQGALAATGNMVAGLYGTPPVSGVQYFASQIDKFNPVQPAYAQGIGFQALAPVQSIWEAFRNLSYIGFVIVFVIIGFMIMFRARLSAQAVATVQDSLPRIVIALVLVTFSYALAGLVIDIMFLLLNVIINALQAVGLLSDRGDIVFTKSVFGLVWGSWGDTFKEVAGSIKNVIDDVIDLPLGLDKIIGFLGGGLAALIVGIAMLFIMFRVFFMLLIAYATIVILTIAAPFFFLFQALPGQNAAKDWFKQIIANVAVFPTVALMFLFAGILGGIDSLGGSGSGAIGGSNIGQFPLLAGDLDPTAIGSLIGVGIMLMTPSAADMVKKAIGAQGGLGAGGAMSSLGAGAGVAMAGARRGYSSAEEHLPQQVGAQPNKLANYAKYVNPAYYKAKGQVRQEERTEAVRKVAKTSLIDRGTSSGDGTSTNG